MKKLNRQNGFTLVEMLACTITLVLVATTCATCMEVAVKSYQASIYESNSQMLESTVSLYMKDILRFASNVQLDKKEENGVEIYEVTALNNPSYQMVGGMLTVGDSGEEDGRIVVFDRPLGEEGCNQTLLIGKNVYAGNLYIDDLLIQYNVSTKCFEGTYTIKCTILPESKRECSFACRSVIDDINIP